MYFYHNAETTKVEPFFTPSELEKIREFRTARELARAYPHKYRWHIEFAGNILYYVGLYKKNTPSLYVNAVYRRWFH